MNGGSCREMVGKGPSFVSYSVSDGIQYFRADELIVGKEECGG